MQETNNQQPNKNTNNQTKNPNPTTGIVTRFCQAVENKWQKLILVGIIMDNVVRQYYSIPTLLWIVWYFIFHQHWWLVLLLLLSLSYWKGCLRTDKPLLLFLTSLNWKSASKRHLSEYDVIDSHASPLITLLIVNKFYLHYLHLIVTWLSFTGPFLMWISSGSKIFS